MENRRVKKQLAKSLEPERQSEANNAVAKSVAHYGVRHAGIGKAHKWSLLTRREPGVLNIGIDALEVGMIEHVLERCIEFQAGAFIQLDVFKNGKIGDVGDRILGEVAASTKRCAKNALRSRGIDDVTDGVLLYRCSINAALNVLAESEELVRRKAARAAKEPTGVTGEDAHRGRRSVHVTDKWPG